MKTRISALFAVVLLVYWPALHGSLIWNDTDYVTKPALQGLGGLWRIWTWAPAYYFAGTDPGTGSTEQYYPLLHSFFWVQHRLWGDSPAGYHLVNVLLHGTAACLLAAVVRRLMAPAPRSDRATERRNVREESDAPTLSRSDALANNAAWLAAALFAVHPVMVESVAWISEQKNTLSTVFYLWAALVYLKWDSDRTKALAASATGSSSSGTRERFGSESLTASATRPYIVASILFVFALLSKSLTASLPAALLVVIWWKRGKIGMRDVLPLLPWFVAGATAGYFTGWVERNVVGAQGSSFGLGILERGLLSGHVIWFYLGKLAWPVGLVFIYPRWTVTASAWTQWLYPIGAIALCPMLHALRKRSRAPLAAYLIFVGTLVPTIGFFNVYGFQFSYVADHWVYLPSIGLIVLAAGGVAQFWFGPVGRPLADASMDGREASASGRPTGGFRFIIPVCACTALLILLGALSNAQTRGYKDPETFYQAILAKNPEAWLAQNNYGLILASQGKAPEAMESFNAAIRLNPQFWEAENNLGALLSMLRRPLEAIPHYERAIQIRPSYAEARYNLGLVYSNEGRTADAMTQYELALKDHPEATEVHLELGGLLAQAGRLDAAIVEFEKAVELDPNRASSQFNLGLAYARAGRMQPAVKAFREAVRLNPSDTTSQRALAQALSEARQAPGPTK